jgi:hypothetical protein
MWKGTKMKAIPEIDDSWKSLIVRGHDPQDHRLTFDIFSNGVHIETVLGIMRVSKMINGKTEAFNLTDNEIDKAFSALLWHEENKQIPPGGQIFMNKYLKAFPGGKHAPLALKLIEGNAGKVIHGKKGIAEYTTKRLAEIMCKDKRTIEGYLKNQKSFLNSKIDKIDTDRKLYTIKKGNLKSIKSYYSTPKYTRNFGPAKKISP